MKVNYDLSSFYVKALDLLFTPKVTYYLLFNLSYRQLFLLLSVSRVMVLFIYKL